MHVPTNMRDLWKKLSTILFDGLPLTTLLAALASLVHLGLFLLDFMYIEGSEEWCHWYHHHTIPQREVMCYGSFLNFSQPRTSILY